MFEIPTYQNVNLVNGCKGNMNTIVKTCFTHNLLVNVLSGKVYRFIIY